MIRKNWGETEKFLNFAGIFTRKRLIISKLYNCKKFIVKTQDLKNCYYNWVIISSFKEAVSRYLLKSFSKTEKKFGIN